MPKPDLSQEIIQATVDLGKLTLAFGQVNRATHYPDGKTFESDTDHTVMLGLLACAFAREYAPHLDLGRVAEFALVHDLVEVYAGDTISFGKLDDEHLKEKEEREAKALERIREEFDEVYPWIGETIEAYESLATPEARFVKVIDKTLPKMVHILNEGMTVRALGHSNVSTKEIHDHQIQKLEKSYGSDQPEAMELLRLINEAVEVAAPKWSA